MNNLRGDQPEKLGLTYGQLGGLKETLVCAHLSAYGREGPRAAWPGYDYLMQAEAGYLSLTGDPDGPPSRMGLSIVDYMTGVTCAFALVSALLGAARTGKGRDVDVSLYDVAMHQLSYPATWYLNEGDVTGRRPRSGHPSVVPCETLPTADGWSCVMCVLPKFWQALATSLGVPELIEDARFKGPRDRYDNRDALMEILDARAATRTSAEWMAEFGGRVPAAPVLDMAQAGENPFFRDRGGVVPAPHPLRYRPSRQPEVKSVAGDNRSEAELGIGPLDQAVADRIALEIAARFLGDRIVAARAGEGDINGPRTTQHIARRRVTHSQDELDLMLTADGVARPLGQGVKAHHLDLDIHRL